MSRLFYTIIFGFILSNWNAFSQTKKNGTPVITNYIPNVYSQFINNLAYLENDAKQAVKAQIASSWAVTQSENGKLYFGTTGGVLEFDGQNWDIIFLSKENNVSQAARSIAYDKNTSHIYVGGQNEFGYIEKQKDGRMAFFSLYKKFKEKILQILKKDIAEIWSIQIYNRDIYFHSRFGVMIYDGKDIRVIPTEESYHRLFVGNGKMYLRQDNIGLCVWKEGKFTPIKFGEMFAPSPNFQISGMIPHYKGGLLLGTRREGLYVYGEFGENKEETFSKKEINPALDEELKKAQIYHIHQLADGTIAIGTLRNGLYILDRDLNLLHHLSEANGLQSNSVLAIFQDNTNYVWLTTFKGITKLSLNPNYIRFDAKNNVNMLFNQLIKYQGITYGTCNLGLFRLDEKTNTFQVVSGILSQAFSMAILDLEGKERFFIGADNLYELVNGNAVPLLNLKGRTIFTGIFTFPNEPNNIYCSTNTENILKITYQEGKAELIETFALPLSLVSSTLGDVKGNVWFANPREPNGNILQYYSFKERKILKKYTFKDFEHLKNIAKPQITTINMFQDFKNKLIVNFNHQCYEYDSLSQAFNHVPRYNHQFGLPDSMNISMLRNRDGEKPFGIIATTADNIWALYLTPKSSKEYALDSIPFKYFYENGYNLRYIDDKNEAWFTGQEDLYKFDLNIKQTYKNTFNTYIKSVNPLHNPDSLFLYNVFGRQDKVQWVLPYTQNSMRFEFSVVDFSSQDKVKFRHRLEGLEEKWSAWDYESYKEFTNLPEGTYTFHVQALNYYGFQGSVATFKFTILPPWQRTWWAYCLYVMGVGIGIYLLVYLNLRRLRKHNEYLARIVKERTIEIEYQKEEILAQSEELKQSNEEISAQKEEIEAQRDLVEKQNHELMDSITYGSRIQAAMLPFKDRIDKTLTEYFILFQPRDVVSGDFYWFLDTHPSEAKVGKAFMAVADCTGHGVPGAFMSMIGNQILYEIISQKNIQNSHLILNELHLEIRRALRQNETENRDGMDIGLIVWDKAQHSLEFSGAKNNLIYFLQDEMHIIKGDKKTIGGEQREEERIFTQNIINLPTNQKIEIYMHSDGYQDQFGGEKRKKFTPQAFRELLTKIHQENMHAQEYTLLHTITNWRNEAQERQTDDMLVWGMRI